MNLKERQHLSEQKKRNSLDELNAELILINNKEGELKTQLKNEESKTKKAAINKKIDRIHQKRVIIKRKTRQIELGKFKNFFKFKRKYLELMYSPTRSSIFFRIFIITIAAFIVTFALHYFIHHGEMLYTGGLRTVQQIILFSTNGALPEWSTYLIFFGLNIPLAYFGWKYIGKWFTMLTLYFLVVQSGFEELLSIPYFEANLGNLYIIQNVSNPDVAQVYISAFVGAVIYGFGVALTFVAGASSGGTKFIVAWLQKKYNMSLGKSSIFIAVIMISIGLLINGVILDHKNFFTVFLSTTTFATAAFIIIQAFIQNSFAPRTKKTSIQIVTSNIDKVIEVIDFTILSKRVWYTYKIKKNKDKKQSSVVVLTVDRREAKFILSKLTKRLPSSQITYNNTNLHSDKYVVRGFD